MTLTPEDKERIEAEERERARVKSEIEEEKERRPQWSELTFGQKFNRVGNGLTRISCGLLLLPFLLIIIYLCVMLFWEFALCPLWDLLPLASCG